MSYLKHIAIVPASTVGICLMGSPGLAFADRPVSNSTMAIAPPAILPDNSGENDTHSILPSFDLSPERSLPEFTTLDSAAINAINTAINISQSRHNQGNSIEQGTVEPVTSLEITQLPRPNQERPPTPNPLPLDAEEQEPINPDEVTPSPPDIPTDEPSDTVEIVVQSIEVLGSSLFDEDDFDPITEPVEGTLVTFEDLQQVADAITQLYLDEGYLTSRAILEEQVITDGIVRIQVIEGRIGEIQIDGNERLRDDYIRNRIELGTRVPLRTDRLEDQLRLLRADPLIENVEASLRAGDDLGESILVVRVVEADAFVLNLRSDNYSPPSVGSERVGLTLGHRNLTERGDSFIINYDRTAQGGSNVVDFSYAIPVNPMNGSVQLRALIDRNRVIQEPFDELDIEGESERYELTYRQPVVRSPREEFALSLGFAYRDGEVLAFDQIPLSIGANDEGVTRTSVFRFGQDYVKRDVQGAWALRSQFSIGTGILNATTNNNAPDGRFFAWLGQAQRVQRIGADHLLIAQLDMQFTPDALLSSEQFVIGGGQSLRGFRQNARAGDNGLRFSLENRITLSRNEAGASIFQVAPFIDLGVVWNDSDNVELPDQTFLAGIGAGLLWEIVPNVDLRLDFTIPLVDLDDRGENIQDDGIYFSVNYEI